MKTTFKQIKLIMRRARFLASAKPLPLLSCRFGQVAPGLLALAAMSVAAAPAETNHAAIPFDQIGAVAGKQYSGDGLAVASSPDGARLRCAFQRLNAQVTAEGLWLASTVDGAKGEPFRVRAAQVGRVVFVGTSRCDVPARATAGGIVAPLNSARTAQRTVPTKNWFRGGWI